MFCKKSVLKNFENFTGEQLCLGLFLTKLQTSKKASTQVFSCEICEFFKSTYFEEFLPTTVSIALLSSSRIMQTRISHMNTYKLLICIIIIFLIWEKSSA